MNVTDDQKLQFQRHSRVIESTKKCFKDIDWVTKRIKKQFAKPEHGMDCVMKHWRSKASEYHGTVLYHFFESKQILEENTDKDPVVVKYLKEAEEKITELSHATDVELIKIGKNQDNDLRAALAAICIKTKDVIQHNHKTLQELGHDK
jgi:hypothetical protein